MTNTSLNVAKANKNDEFYTQLSDIENELQNYKHHFKGKKILCNCDDPFESNFFLYFALNFKHLGLVKLTTTCYKGSPIAKQKNQKHGFKIELTEMEDYDGDGMITKKDVEIFLANNPPIQLKGDGAFESAECIELMKECDIVITNPPFSRFRDFISQLMALEKEFLVIGSWNSITCKELFSLLKENKMWLGYNPVKKFMKPDGTFKVFGNISWLTNLDITKRHNKLDLYMEYKGNEKHFPTYDEYDAIEVGKVKEIPKDYVGKMGVPISFLNQYNPDQFEIIGIDRYVDDNPHYGHRFKLNGKEKYARILIKRRTI